MKADVDAALDLMSRAHPHGDWTRTGVGLLIRGPNTSIELQFAKSMRLVGSICLTWTPTQYGILDVSVDPALRRLGIGRSLVDHVKRMLTAERKHVVAYVPEASSAGRQLLQATGFQLNGTVAKFFRDGSAAHFMSYAL